MSKALIKESISALTELVTQTVNEKSLSKAAALSESVSDKIQELLNASKKGVLLKAFSEFFIKLAKTDPLTAESFESIEMTFEVGPQYNDEGYDLRITYDSGIEAVFKKGAKNDIEIDESDLFHDWIHSSLSPKDFEGWFNKPVSLDYSHRMTVYIANPDELFELLAIDTNPSFRDFSEYLNISVESSKADSYY